jgi:prepilin-type N-terminal cleavage/methylation domain-containing protein
VSRQRGFTLIEMLLSVTIIGLLVGLSVPFYQTFVQRNDLDIATQSVATALRRAQSYARNGNYDAAWSIEVQAGTVTLFQGTDFINRNTNYDETYDFPGSITPSGTTEVQFAQFTADPTPTSASIVLTSTTNDTRTITVNAQGAVDY